jgi:hypothetical protein
MSSPVVAGIASLLLGYNPNLYNDDVENLIRMTAVDINDPSDTHVGPGWDEGTGEGRVNARAALEHLQSPYVLLHKSASGGSENSHTGYYGVSIYNVPSLSDGYYYVKRYDVRKSVSWTESLDNIIVWGCGVGSNGFSNESPIYGMPFCNVISNTDNSAVLQTYVYHVWTTQLRDMGWIPTTISGTSFNYSVFGEEAPVYPLSVTISGPTALNFKQWGEWDANVSGGTSPYSYQWYKKIGAGTWTTWWTTSTVTYRMGMSDLTLKCVVTDNWNQTDEDTHFVEYGLVPKPAAGEEATISIPDNHIVAQNYPNPFNPETQIRFSLPEDSKVTIEVFNLQGRKVATLADGYYEAGYHSVTFRGANHPSGVYFYRTVAGEFQDIKRMLLIK